MSLTRTENPAPRVVGSRRGWTLAILLVALAATPVVLRYLVFWPLDQWQVDLEVYREAGVSLLSDRSVYDTITESPQLLPFTYPPFAAVLSVPLALLPFGVVGWLWTVAQVAATTLAVGTAAYPLLVRSGARAPLLLAALVVPILWLHPVADGIRFGQVNAFIVLACLLDLRAPRPRFLRWVPAGVLVGLAMAVKLTPGVFVVHYLLNRRWREAAAAIGAAAAATLTTAAVLPGESKAFWWGALTAPDRLGPNAGTSNQSLRGVLLRIGPDGTAGTLLWVIGAAAIAVIGYAVARRLWRAGDTISEVAVLGLLAVLLSPVAWIHHLHWMVVVIPAVLGAQRSFGLGARRGADRDAGGDVGVEVEESAPEAPGARDRTRDRARDRRRLVAALVLTAWFLARMPWWGITWMANDWWPFAFGRLLQNADLLGALVALGVLWWVGAQSGAEVRTGAEVGSGAEGKKQQPSARTAVRE